MRDRVLGALERGERPSDIARRFEVSRVWVYDVRNRFRDRGERCSYRVGGYRQSRIADLEMRIRC
ncbi:MAG: helix-turn-helix domain-containing protein [Proteobacteria bacterium]|nr:helix-turn-helix domain-containing protein [Pseudomonadota bacterium]